MQRFSNLISLSYKIHNMLFQCDLKILFKVNCVTTKTKKKKSLKTFF